MRVSRKTRLGELLEAFPDLDYTFDANDIDISGADEETTLAQLCAQLEIAFEDLQAVILEALGGELDPADSELDDFEAEDPDAESDPLEGLNVPGYDEEEEEEIDEDDLFGGF